MSKYGSGSGGKNGASDPDQEIRKMRTDPGLDYRAYNFLIFLNYIFQNTCLDSFNDKARSYVLYTLMFLFIEVPLCNVCPSFTPLLS